MLFKSVTTLFLAALAFGSGAAAWKKNATSPVTYYGTQGPLFTSGTSTNSGILFTSGTAGSLNGSIVTGGIANETRQVLTNIGNILEEAGTSWEYALKVTILLANISDYAAMNTVYRDFLPSPKPARTAVQVGELPGDFLIEVEAVVAIPEKKCA
ncbi:endoribonuclease L-PSP [Phlyctema vagabunda]|uniref:Endoribonuclease L-PSP n=1 Tax=Phlyctema vagabunda TaxID=108571 RepID=A0ABR4PZ27_9HELO